MLGSAIFVSGSVVYIRRQAFARKFAAVADEKRSRRVTRKSSWRALSRVMSATSDTRSANAVDAMLTPVEPADHATHDERNEPGLAEHVSSDYIVRPSEDMGTNVYVGEALGLGGMHATRVSADQVSQVADRITFSPETQFRSRVHDEGSPTKAMRRRSIVSLQGVGALPGARLHTAVHRSSLVSSPDERRAPTHKLSTDQYFPSAGWISRNSQFHGLTEVEREKLGGVEHLALVWLSWLVPLYFVLWQLLGCIGLAAYVAMNRESVAKSNGLNPWWVGAFNAVSAFNNSGMSLLDANMTAFQTSYYMLITMSLLILAGNTCYPIFLRLIIWTLLRIMPDSPRWSEHRQTLRFLLDHPRRCYTNLFPSRHTWWLLLAVVTLNGIDWAAFEILNIGNTGLTDILPTNVRVIDGLFQAFAVRSGGFYVVAIPTLRISLQVLYVVMMYISVYPVVITMRNSNVYEERSLGIYTDDPGYESFEQGERQGRQAFWRNLIGMSRLKRTMTGLQDTKSYFVRQQVRAQLAHDAWWVVLAVFLVMIIESGHFEADPANFSVFNFIFEIVSAYGTVGISVGVPNQAYSFCGSWHVLSKLVLCAVMLRGRHRGLPVAIDKAVSLPEEQHGHAEEEDAMIRLERATSRSLHDVQV